EDIGYFTHLRKQTSTPLAMGELFNNAHEWAGLVSGRLIDFIRCHLSQVGGLTAGRKIAALCDFFAVCLQPHAAVDLNRTTVESKVSMSTTPAGSITSRKESRNGRGRPAQQELARWITNARPIPRS